MNVKKTSINMPRRVAKAKSVMFEDGERSCVVVDLDGMPLYYPNLYLTTQVRNRSLSSSTIANVVGDICVFLQILEERRIDLIDRFSMGCLLESHEIESLRGDLQKRLLPDAAGKVPSCFAEGVYVSKEIVHARVNVAAKYIEWLAGRYLKAPADPERLGGVLKAIRDIRPINKNRNTLNRQKGLDTVSAIAVKELLRPGSDFNIWEDEGIQARNHVMLTVLYELGIRRGELLNLRCEDVDFRKNRIYIMRRADEKSDPRAYQPLVKTRDRELVIKSSLARDLLNYINNFRRKVPGARQHGFLFVTHKAGPTQGLPLTISGYKDVVSSIRERISPLENFSGHDLRHYWNHRFSELSDEIGMSPAEEEQLRSQLMGWSFGSGTAATYMKRFVAQKAAEVSFKLQQKGLRPIKGDNK